MIPVESSKSKNQVVHEQKFKDPLSSTCQISSERRMLDLESEVNEGAILTAGNILSLGFFLFSRSKASVYEKLDWAISTIPDICSSFACIHINVAEVTVVKLTKLRNIYISAQT